MNAEPIGSLFFRNDRITNDFI